MKTTKYFYGILLAIGLLGISVLNIVAQTAEEYANAFAKQPAVEWRGNVSFYGQTSNDTSPVFMTFTADPVQGARWGFTQIGINDTAVAIDPSHPEMVFPTFAGRCLDFELYMVGYDRNGRAVRQATFYKSELLLGDEIKVDVFLDYITSAQQVTLRGDHNAGNTEMWSDGNQYGGYFDTQTGEWVANYDPMHPPSKWIMIDSRDNSVYGFFPFRASPSGGPITPQGNGLAIEMPEGGLELTFIMNDNATLSGFALDQVVSRQGTSVNAKIVDVQALDSGQYLQFLASDLRAGSWLEVWGFQSDGTPVLVRQVSASDNYGSQFGANDVTGYSAYKVVLCGAVFSQSMKARIDIYHDSYPWGITIGGGGGGGGGKGVVGIMGKKQMDGAEQ